VSCPQDGKVRTPAARPRQDEAASYAAVAARPTRRPSVGPSGL